MKPHKHNKGHRGQQYGHADVQQVDDRDDAGPRWDEGGGENRLDPEYGGQGKIKRK